MRVSVISGYYNRRQVLRRTVESILAQTFTDFELIVVDDASTDGTADAIRELQAEFNDPRFRAIIHSTNQGFVKGLRDAIAQSSGEYIAIHGSGDVALPRRLEMQVALLDSDEGLGAVGCWYENVDEATGVRSALRPDAGKADMPYLMEKNIFSHGEVMIRREAYDLVGGYREEFRFAQDIDLWLRIREHFRLATVPEFLYERYILSDGVTYNPSKFATQARFSLLARRLTLMTPSEVETALEAVRRDGPGAVIAQNDPQLQKRLISGTIQIGRSGSPKGAVASAKANISNPVVRASLVAFFTLYGLPLVGPALKGLWHAAGSARKQMRRIRTSPSATAQ